MSDLIKKQPDHRWSARQALVLPVKLFMGGRPVGEGRTRNIGIGGTLLELQTPAPDSLEFNTQLSVAFTTNHKEQISHHRIPAIVIWINDNCLGLMFCDFNVETVYTLRDVMYPEE